MEKKELLKDVMYNMFLDGVLPELDMEDYIIMWKALIEHWNIDIDDLTLEKFFDDINCKSSNKYDWFTNTFNNYFNN